MKLAANSINLTKSKVFFLLIGIFSLSSCKKDKLEDTRNIGIKVSVLGIEDYVDVDINSNKATISRLGINSPSEIVSYDGFDAITSIQVSEPHNSKMNSGGESIQNKASNKANISTAPLNDSVRYRLIFINTNNNNIDTNIVVQVGTAPGSIKLTPGVNYKWVAYSVNRSTVPNIDLATKTLPRRDLVNKDFLFDSDTFTPAGGANEINIVFKRFTTQYVVNVDVRGMFATLRDITKTTLVNRTNNNNMFTTADFNILSEGFSNDSTIHFLGSQMLPITTHQDQKTVRFHSVNTNASLVDSLRLNFSPLSLTMDDGSTREFTTAGVSFNNHAAISGERRGVRYTINARLVESAIQVQGDASNTQWARSNLWYSSGNARGAHRFRVSPHFRDTLKTNISIYHLTDVNDLWRYGSISPDASNTGADPCLSVYPDSLWIMPKNSQFDFLANQPHLGFYIIDRGEPLYRGVLGLVFPNKFFEYVIRYKSKTVSSDTYKIPFRPSDQNSTSEDLFLSGIGYNEANDSPVERPTYTAVVNLGSGENNILSVLGGFTGAGLYWSKNPNETVPPSIASFFRFRYTQGSLIGLDIGILGLTLISGANVVTNRTSGLLSSNKLNIRCVRNPDYVATF